MATRAVHLQRDWYDVRVDRLSPWGNPFGLAGTGAEVVVATKTEAVAAHARWLAGDPRSVHVQPQRRRWVLANVGRLRGKRLGCWCAPPGGLTAADPPHDCHGQTLAGLADAHEEGHAPMTEEITPTAGPAADLATLGDLATEALEQIVTEGQQTFMRVGTALKVLQERKAYRERGYATFEDYCRATWGFSRQQGYRLMTAAETMTALSPIGDGPLPANEAQTRELAKVAPDLRAAVWQLAVETAPGGHVTADHVAAVVARHSLPAGPADAPDRVVQVAAITKTIDDMIAVADYTGAEEVRQTLWGAGLGPVYRYVRRARGQDSGPITAPEAPPERVEPVRHFYSLEDWAALSEAGRQQALARRDPQHTFNPQTSESIEWARWSWNPVTGCKHDCSYCYARDIAARYFPQGFAPAFLPERLDGPRNTKVPADKVAADPAYGNVFTCSMADLFGRWVPAAWIEAVLDQVRANPQWNFLFLTKFPTRLQEFAFPDNAWVGTTVDAQARVANAERAFAKVTAKVKWLSCEPLLEPVRFSRLDLFDWVVVGGASASTQTPEWRPPWDWHAALYEEARRAGCRVYMKTNLLERVREYPGRPDPTPINVPDAFKMRYLQRDVLEPEVYTVEHGGVVVAGMTPVAGRSDAR